MAVISAATSNTNKKLIFKNCPPFTDCISKINNNIKYQVKQMMMVQKYWNNGAIKVILENPWNAIN